MVVSQHCSVRMPLTISRPMPCWVSQMSSPLLTSALWRCLVKVAAPLFYAYLKKELQAGGLV